MARVFVKGCWVVSTFWFSICYNFCYILRKIAKLYFLEASHQSLKITSIGSLITEKSSFKKLKILTILARFISKIEKPDLLNFPLIKYFVKCFLLLKTWNVRVNYCRNYVPSNLLFCFTGHNLVTLNNRQR